MILKLQIFFVFLFLTAAVYSLSSPIDNFEGILEWKSAPNSDPSQLSIVAQNASSGKNSLKVVVQNTGKGKAMIFRQANRELSDIEAFTFDAYNPQQSHIEVALALQIGNGWVWNESKPVSLKPGWNKGMKIDLTKKDFKSQASNWQNNSSLDRKLALAQINLLIFPSQLKTVELYLDNLQWETSDGGSSKATSPTSLIEGFESGVSWKSMTGGAPVTIKQSNQGATEGKSALQISFSGAKSGLSREIIEDLHAANALLLDIFNSSIASVDFAVAFQTGKEFVWYESPTINLPAGQNKNVRIDLTKSNFKTAGNGWQYSAKIGNPEQAKSITLMLYPKNNGILYVDNIRLEKSANAPKTKTSQIESNPKIILAANTKSSTGLKVPKIQKVTGNEKVEKYAKFEADVKFSGDYQNPFDPQEIALDATVLSPSEKKFTVPGYMHGKDPSQNDLWKIRFAPNETGTWSYTVKVTNQKGSDISKEYKFEVVDSNLKGPSYVDPSDWRYFRFANGDFFYPVGEDVAWLFKPEEEYANYFSKMNAVKANWARVWMCTWGWTNLECKVGDHDGVGLGRYSIKNAERIDKILDEAARNGIYIQLVLNHHGQFSTTVNPNWNDNPYSADLGGPLKYAGEVFTNSTAIQLFKNRYRYIVARWGYHPALASWELWNEVSQTDNYGKQAPLVGQWHQDMAEYIHSIDIQKHPITTSYADYANNKPDIDFTQIHCYNKDYIGSAQFLDDDYYKFKKPVFFGEIGDPIGYGKDTEAIPLHQWMWASMAQPQAGTAMGWTWDNYVNEKNLYFVFEPVANFAEGLDRGKYKLDKDAEYKVISQTLKFSTISFAPLLGWAPSSESTFLIGNDGKINGLGGLSKFFQAPNHANMKVDPIFILNCPAPGEFVLYPGQSSGLGSGLQILLDGRVMLEAEFPRASDKRAFDINTVFRIPLTAGSHKVQVKVNKNDWMTVDKLEVTHYGSPIKVVGVAGPEAAVLWLTNPTYNMGDYYKGVRLENVGQASIEVFGLKDGGYKVELWDTYHGVISNSAASSSKKGVLTFELPDFNRDIAIKIMPSI